MEAAIKTVDTLNLAKRYKGVDFTVKQAERLAESARELEQNQLSNLVTSAELREAASELKQALVDQKSALVIWFSGMLLAQGAFVVGFVALLIKVL